MQAILGSAAQPTPWLRDCIAAPTPDYVLRRVVIPVQAYAAVRIAVLPFRWALLEDHALARARLRGDGAGTVTSPLLGAYCLESDDAQDPIPPGVGDGLGALVAPEHGGWLQALEVDRVAGACGPAKVPLYERNRSTHSGPFDVLAPAAARPCAAAPGVGLASASAPRAIVARAEEAWRTHTPAGACASGVSPRAAQPTARSGVR